MRRESEFRYSKLAHILREQILSGYIRPGEFLLSENELCRHYGISRTSVRKSLDQLQKEGLIIKKVGQGTIVSPDLVLPEGAGKVLRIMVPSPSHYAEHCLPHIIDAFKSKYPNVEVRLLGFPSNNFRESMHDAMELGHAPNLLLVTDRQFDELNQSASFMNLQDRFQTTLDAMYPRLVEGFRRDGGVKAIPATFSPVYLAYNARLFAEQGIPRPEPYWALDDFMSVAKRLTLDTDQDGITNQFGLLLSSSSSRWPVVALQNGYQFRPDSSREALVKTLEFIQDAVYRQRSVTLCAPTYGANTRAFIYEKTAMVLTTAIEAAGWRHDELTFEPQLAPLPFGPEKASLLVANGFMIPTHCPDFDLTALFLETAFDRELQISLARNTHFLSCLTVNHHVWEEDDLRALNLIGDQIINCLYLSELFEDPMLIGELELEMELFWAGLESAESLADRMAKIIAGA